jgi:hypothetical protein
MGSINFLKLFRKPHGSNIERGRPIPDIILATSSPLVIYGQFGLPTTIERWRCMRMTRIFWFWIGSDAEYDQILQGK